MASSHHDLLAFVGVTLVLLVHSLYSRFSHRRQRLNLPDDAKTPRDGETESLLPRRLTTVGRPLFIKGCIIGIAATGYMAIAIYVSVKTIIALQGPVLDDSRFFVGRLGTVFLAVIAIMRCAVSDPSVRLGARSDAVALIIAPYVIYLIKTPIPDSPEIPWLDLIVAPTLGAICWLGAGLEA